MSEIRERKLVMDGTVCEDAHSYQDPEVKTASDARARGKERCPIFNACMFRDELDKRRVICAARVGQEVARNTMRNGTSVESEMKTFRAEAHSPRSSTADFDLIDPYKDPDDVVSDRGQVAESVEGWADTVLYGPQLNDGGTTEPTK